MDDTERRQRRYMIDLGPLRDSRDFRLVWTSGVVTLIGSMFTMVALPLQIADTTGSPWAVGLIGAVELVPMVVFGLYGGVLADRFDRRAMALATELALGVLSLALLANTLLDAPLLWPLYAAAGCAAALQGLQQPSLEAMVPRLVPHEQLTDAGALTSLRWSVGGVVGPALAGLVVTAGGFAAAYAVDVATFAISLLLLWRLRPVPTADGATPAPALREIAEGLAYAWSRPDLLGTYLADMAATVLAVPTALFPFLASELDAPWALGLLYAASGAGALLAAATGGWTGRVHHHGRMVLLAGAAVGAATAAAAVVGGLWAVIILLAVAGAAGWVGDVFRTTMWNASIPDRLRGRLAGVELLIGAAGPAAGDLRAGGTAARFGIKAAMWSGGLVCLGSVGVLTAALPALWRYDDRTDPHASAVRAESREGA
ncbi:MFS transporter [Nocardiopsis rhodophaea]|uniref:MFS transporter n=1 Tax=Nocardiopsis rhodophaea TaxID=280238 RepID=A0ABP5E1N9_9ACTN